MTVKVAGVPVGRLGRPVMNNDKAVAEASETAREVRIMP